MNELTDNELLQLSGGIDAVDYFAGLCGIAVGAFLATTGAGAFAAESAGLATAAVVKEMIDGPAYTPGLDDRYAPIVTA